MNSANLSEYSYLVIDDDQFTCDLIARLLRKHGATQIKIADDGATAITQIKTDQTFPDIIICDLNMPGLDGVEFVRYLAKEMYTGGLVLISGSDMAILNAVSRLAQAQFLSILGTLSKPFTPDELLKHLSAYTGLRRRVAASV